MELIFELVEADRGCIMLIDPGTKPPAQGSPHSKGFSATRISISKTILDYVIEQNEGVFTSDARQDDRGTRRQHRANGHPRGDLRADARPLRRGRRDLHRHVHSAQQMIKQGGANKFSEDHLKLMIAIGHQAALAVEDTRYYSAMVQAERLAAIGQTIATLSHHIKNILQGIRGGSYLIEMGLKEHDEEVVRKGWTIVERNQNRISTLVMDMLTFSKEREPDLHLPTSTRWSPTWSS